MRLNPTAVDRLRGAKLRPEGLITIFETLVQACEYLVPESVTYRLDFQGEGDQVAEGDLIPVITISLRPATLEKTVEQKDAG